MMSPHTLCPRRVHITEVVGYWLEGQDREHVHEHTHTHTHAHSHTFQGPVQALSEAACQQLLSLFVFRE